MKLTMAQGWNDLSEEVQVPAEIAAAFAVNRPELLTLAARAMSKEEVEGLLQAIRVLMDTNAKLQAHSLQLAQKTENIVGQFFGFEGMFEKLASFATFQEEPKEDDVL